jgi:transposase-like protein
MKPYPVTVIDFQDMFPTDEACYGYLHILRWPDGFVCPHCSHNDAWKMKKGLYRCKDCREEVSVISGTIFQGTRTSLRLWFQAIWYAVNQKHGVSALGLQRILGLKSYETAWAWMHKLRTAMVRPGRDRLRGLVEVDETLIGGPKPGKRGRGDSGKVLVLVAVEGMEGTKQKGIGRIRLKVISDASGPTLKDAIAEMVESGSTVRTDGWKGYNGLKEKGYDHVVVQHEEEELGFDPTPLVHRVSSLLKRWLLGIHHGRVAASHLHYYLDEFTFRFNRRRARSRGKLFYELIRQALMVAPAPLKSLKSA